MIELYENIKKFRLERKMSQVELAKLTGYTDRSSITKIERGAVDLPQSKILLFAKALRVSPGELMGNTGIESPEVPKNDHIIEYNKNTKKEQEMIKKYRVLDDHGQEVVDTVLQIEYDRVTDSTLLMAAHERTDVEKNDDMMKHDINIMKDEGF